MVFAASRPLDLKRHLLTRVSLFALAVLLLGTVLSLLELRYRVRADLQRTGQTIRQLVTDEINRSRSAFDRNINDLELSLAPLQPVGELVHFCLRMTDLYAHPGPTHCFPGNARLPDWLESVMALVIGDDARFQAPVGQYPGITVGELTVTPDYGSELAALGRRLGNLLLVTVLILFMNLLIYRPVRRALAPADEILGTLGRMEGGDLAARVPDLPLIEFTRIGQGLNHLADRLQQTIGEQRRLAHRLLSAREEERQHLSRELHDEFGQYLASINAEAAYARELADESLPALRPCADSISATTQHMMESLQQILHRLRPVGLEEFGLQASLEQLVADWNQRGRGRTTLTLEITGPLAGLSDDINVSLYRIVQEGITNALRHGQADRVAIDLQVAATALTLDIRDNGRFQPRSSGVVAGEGTMEGGVESERRQGGYGLLGMEERVLALGGTLSIGPAEGGTRLAVWLPLATDEGSAR
jgi:protein-histidine pros-kinase